MAALFKVSASLDSDDYTISQAPYKRDNAICGTMQYEGRCNLKDNASTQALTDGIEVKGDSFDYQAPTVVDISGRILDHTDATDSDNLVNSAWDPITMTSCRVD